MNTKKHKRTQKQLTLQSHTHGGARRDAGRPKSSKLVPHTSRPTTDPRHPLHITVRLRAGMPNLRTKAAFNMFRHAIKGAREHGVRILHFAVLGNHFHLIVEADRNKKLFSAMKSLNIRLAKALNAKQNSSGRTLSDRYHTVILKTPTQMKAAIRYVLTNAAKHFRSKHVFDWYSSFLAFGEVDQIRSSDFSWLKPKIGVALRESYSSFVDPPQSWLASVGWMRALG